jgi:hypothetical protein
MTMGMMLVFGLLFDLGIAGSAAAPLEFATPKEHRFEVAFGISQPAILCGGDGMAGYQQDVKLSQL